MLRIIADENIPLAREAFASLGNVATMPGRAMNAAAAREADVLLVRSITPVNAALLEGSRARFVGTATIGTDHVDEAWLKARGIAFASAPGSNADSVADYITAALLEIAARRKMRLAGKTIGIIGVGNVGGRVARRAEALGIRPLRNDPPLARQTGDKRFLPLEALFDADFITLHTPLSRRGPDATYHLVDERFLARMRPDAALLNSSRGAVAHGEALLRALRAGRLAAVALDVWEGEPEISAELLDAVALGTPHIAGYSYDGKIKGTMMLRRALCEHLGIADDWDPEPNLPAPENPEIILRDAAPTEEMIRQAVRQVYDIRRDDAALRAMTRLAPNERGAYFDRLRRDYPVRREFTRYRARVPAEAREAGTPLAELGFKMVECPAGE